MLPDTITAFSTLGLVLVTGALVIVTWMYVREVKSQAATINQQAGSMKDQADAMKRQADAMDGQSSLMHENMEYDQLVRKYERLNRTMNGLVAPLFSKKDDDVIFITGVDTYPARKEYTEFWEYIKKNIYLADKDLYSELDNYFLAVKMYKNSGTNVYGSHPQDASNLFMAEKDKIIKQIELSHNDLKEEMRQTELELKIR
jgi:hypothetical protein